MLVQIERCSVNGNLEQLKYEVGFIKEKGSVYYEAYKHEITQRVHMIMTDQIKLNHLIDGGFLEGDTLNLNVRICGIVEEGSKAEKSNPRNNYLKQMFEEQLHADITIETSDGQTFRAAKCILSRSPVFDKMLSNGEWKEAKEGIIKIKDITFDAIYELVRYLYCDEVPKLSEMTLDLLIAADKYDITGLKEICLRHLTSQISMENFVEIFIHCDHLNISELKKSVIDFIVKNRREMVGSDKWDTLKLYPDLVIEIVEAFMVGF